MMNAKLALSVLVLCLFGTAVTVLPSCGTASDNEEIGQQVGDAMASLDESGGSSGSLAMLPVEGFRKTFKRLSNSDVSPAWYENLLESEATATACRLATTFGTCTANVITRTFGDCTVGAATFSGTVTLTFNDATSDGTCQMTTASHSITRVPAFSVTGRRGATLTVSKTGTIGQKITKGAGATFTFTNDGIRRVFTSAAGATLFDFTTATTADITVTGTSRANRTMDGGTLRVTNNLTNGTCDYSPTDVTWTAACNCATSGSWSGTCSDGKTTNLAITGCGTATLTVGSESESITFDRCEGA
jgi:hypothetical protein